MTLRLLLLRPPRFVWPFNSESSAFWPPLALLCLAAAIRREMAGVDVQVWDCPGERTGWKTLTRRLAETRIYVLGIGEETVSAHEALRAAGLVKRLQPGCTVVAGGVYFSNAVDETLRDGRVDVVVRGEGESTFVELLRHIDDRTAWPRIHGIAFRNADGGITITPRRPLIDDLDTVPFPAYDAIDVRHYGRRSANHPRLASVEHSRGCIDSCSFCILWSHMGQSANGNGRLRPRLRSKSPERSFDEVRWLYHRFRRRTFGWVDPTFNASPGWADEWAERMLASDLMSTGGQPRTLHTAWLRADGVVRDESLGILEKMVRAGLRQVMIGLERDDPAGLASLGKHNNDPDLCRRAFAIFRERYPQVYTIGTAIFGLPGDTLDDLNRLAACQYSMGIDYLFIMPLTPNPGTAAAAQARAAGRIANPDLSSYNFHTPVCTTDHLDLRQLESVYWRLLTSPSRARARQLVKKLFEADRRKRRVHAALLWRGTRIAANSLLRAVLHRNDSHPTQYWRKPSWYET